MQCALWSTAVDPIWTLLFVNERGYWNEYISFLDLGSEENEDEGEDENEAEEDHKTTREVTLEDIRRYNQMDILRVALKFKELLIVFI